MSCSQGLHWWKSILKLLFSDSWGTMRERRKTQEYDNCRKALDVSEHGKQWQWRRHHHHHRNNNININNTTTSIKIIHFSCRPMKIIIKKCYCNICVKKPFLGILNKLKKSALCLDWICPSVCDVVLANKMFPVFLWNSECEFVTESCLRV
jgi:hypothetical protein